LQETDHIWQ
jgi:cystathionine gamma-lyase